VHSNGNRPLIAHVRYGLGQITYLAFSLEDASFLKWQKREKFLETIILNLAPRAPGNLGINDRVVAAPLVIATLGDVVNP